MEDTIYLLICLVVIIVWFVYAFWSNLEGEVRSESELHARNRYSVAEEITKEFDKKYPPFN